MKFKGKNIARNIVITLALILLIGSSVSFGVSYNKEITAWFYNIQVKLNGKALYFSKQPFIYDGSVYIPLRDVSENLGIDVKWEGETKTVYLTDNSIPNYYPNSSQQVLVNNKSIDDVEDELNEKYEEYTDGYKDLEFEYKLTKQSSYIKVRMEGSNFKKDSSHWSKRDDNDFQDFVKDVAKSVADDLDEDVKVYVYDESNKSLGRYEYDEGKNKFEVEYEYGEEKDEDDVESELNEDYDEYTDGEDDLEFEYTVSSSAKVKMKGKNFERDSSKWEERDDSDFENFVEDIAKLVSEALEKDVTVEVYDDKNKRTAEYEYDESKDEFEVKYEYGEEQDEDDVENELNSDYEEYTEGDYKLEFEYTVSSSAKVTMKSKNFGRDSSRWEERKDSKFEDFVEGIAELVSDALDKDVTIEVYDDENEKTAEYKYDKSEDNFDVEYEYDKDNNIETLQSKLDNDYDKYTEGSDRLEFAYELDDSNNNYIKVVMNGGNFKRSSSKWENRGDSKFKSFIKDMAKEVEEVFSDLDVKVYVYDEDNNKAAQYTYDESKDTLVVISQHQ